MHALVSSDFHLDWSTAGVPRLADLSQAVDELVKQAKARECDEFWFLGDLCDPDNAADVLRAGKVACEAATRLARWGIVSRWVSGNHDVVEDGRGTTTLAPLASIGGEYVRVYERPISLGAVNDFGEARPIHLCALPYPPATSPYSVEETVDAAIELAGGNPLIVLSHLMIEGIGPGSETKDMPRGRDIFLPERLLDPHCPANVLVLNGHYHRRQIFRGVQVPGSLGVLTFGESENTPQYLIVEV